MKIITVHRRPLFADVTSGELFFDGQFICYSLEDKDRGLHQLMSPQSIEQVKIQDKTAIPYGFYEVVIDFSNRFKKNMPHILDVPGFEGIRIHAGNTHEDTSGCILVGKGKVGDTIGMSKLAYEELFQKIQSALSTERVFISVTR
jgi:hypothetical protein